MKGRTIAQEIGELKSLDVPALVEKYRKLFGKPPRCKNREHLFHRVAWKIQEARLGGLSTVAKRRLEELIAEIDVPIGERQSTVTGTLRSKVRSPHQVGTVFTRVWREREIRATAVENGYEHQGVVYRSLSAVAKAITGAHWNGRLFFGLTKRAKNPSRKKR